MLNEAMTYIRTDTTDFSTRLSREELRVFTAVQGETGVAAIVAKTRLDPAQVADRSGLVHHSRPQPLPTPLKTRLNGSAHSTPSAT